MNHPGLAKVRQRQDVDVASPPPLNGTVEEALDALGRAPTDPELLALHFYARVYDPLAVLHLLPDATDAGWDEEE